MTDTYTYKVRDRSGKLIEGSLEADSTSLVVARLKDLGYIPLSIDKKSTSKLNKEFTFPGMNPIKLIEVAVFSRQFATMVNSGLTLLRSISILSEQADNKALAEALNKIRLDIEKGSSLSQALAKYPKIFNKLYVAMVRAGEVGGVLDSVLLQLSSTIEKQVELRRKIKSALTYPSAVLGFVVIILVAMLLFVVPSFKNIYSSLGGTLPLPTRILMSISTGLANFFPFVIIAIGLLIFGFRRYIATEKGRSLWDKIKLKIWLFGKLIHKTSLARFSRTLSSLLKAGVPILESLEITKDTVGNSVVADAVVDAKEGVRQGESLAARFMNHPVFPPMVVQMLSVGEETGSVDTMLEKVAEFYEQEVEAIVDSLTSLLEPALMVVLGGAVGSMIISLYLPMFDVIKLIH